MKKHPTGPFPHPALSIALDFDRARYRWFDSEGDGPYEFATRLIARHFPPFDQDAVARRVAARTGQTVAEVLAGWKASADYGDEIHAYAEARVQGEAPPPGDLVLATPADCAVVDATLAMLADGYELWGAEQIVFDPLWRVAARVDLVGRNRATGALAILDWKTNETLDERAYGHALPPIESWPDSKVAKYALELSIPAALMLGSGYVAKDVPVELACIHIPRGCREPRWVPLEYAAEAVQALVEHAWAPKGAPEPQRVLGDPREAGGAGYGDDELVAQSMAATVGLMMKSERASP
jgi:hypothetical protein